MKYMPEFDTNIRLIFNTCKHFGAFIDFKKLDIATNADGEFFESNVFRI